MTSDDFLDSPKTPALFTEEECSRLILQNTEDCYVLLNRQLQIVYCNHSAQAAFRHFLKADPKRGVDIMSFVAEPRKVILEAIYAAVLKGEKRLTEIRLQPDGKADVFFENNFLPAFDENGDVAGVLVMSKDITEKKKTQQSIIESEERLQFALEAARQGVWDWNLETNEVIYSASYKKLYGFADDELKDHVSEWITRIHPEDQKKMQESISEHLQADNPVYDSQYRIRNKDGQYRWVLAKGRLIYETGSAKPVRMIGTHTDITEAIEREAALKQINERFDCMMQATHELLWEWDIRNKQMLQWTGGPSKLFGAYNDGNIRTMEEWLAHIHPDDQQPIRKLLNDVMKAPHQHTFEMEYRFQRSGGDFAHIYDRGILLKDESGAPVRIIGAAEDISERIRLEKELLRTELEHHRQLHQATVDTQEKERAEIGKELHDNINQVLTTTKLCLDLALAKTELRENLIEKSIGNINKVIREIRHLSRSLIDTSINDLGLVESLRDLIEDIRLTKKLHVVEHLDASIDSLLQPHQKLAVFRIVQEAIKNVLGHANATTLSIVIGVEGSNIRLTVKDDGEGFDTTQVKPGVGLKNIQNRIYLINGTLQLDSSPKKGCCMQLQFPIEITN